MSLPIEIFRNNISNTHLHRYYPDFNLSAAYKPHVLLPAVVQITHLYFSANYRLPAQQCPPNSGKVKIWCKLFTLSSYSITMFEQFRE